ncbi:MAG: alpha-galactosidase [Thermoguttaceae bacterium]|nr:alpha-galactosidase [Thermoguttaceae bacterium]
MKRGKWSVATAVAVALGLAFCWTANGAVVRADSPFDPKDSDFKKWAPILVDDAVMPKRGEVDAVADWVRRAFGGETGEATASSVAADSVRIVVERQDYSRLRFNETAVGEKFAFPNGVVFKKGLGTHSHSRLRVLFPEPVAKFAAKVGIDRQNPQGSVRCAVEVGGKIVFRTETIRGGEDAVPVEIAFVEPVAEFALLVDDAGDGPICDQLNWLEPVATTADGKKFDLVDDAIVSRLPDGVPFSFEYDGVSSREFLDSWTRTVEKLDDYRDVYSWTDPKTKLTVFATVRRFEKFAAVDWVLHFKNGGTENSPTISNVQVLDVAAQYGIERKSLAVKTLRGDTCDENAWAPVVQNVAPGEKIEFAPKGGRSSNGAFPFWNVSSRRYGDAEPSEGLFVALGWSGQWKASFENGKESVSTTIVKAGMEEIATILIPGEEIRSPRALLMPWRGDVASSHALFRRLLMFEYAPKIDGTPVEAEIIAQCFDRYYRKRPGWEKVGAQIETARALKKIGGTAHWFDAAWFPVGFPNGVGNWFSDETNFPNGVEELGDALEEMGLNFVLWFEPERVAAGTEIATKYPQFVFGGSQGGLYKLNDPEARKFLTDLLLKRVKDFKVDVYRNDFNLDPLPFWRAADEPNRRGMTEIRYVEGHYELWNRLRSENPGLWIDNCASGGRRIDLETTSISLPLWRSDTCCWAGHPEWDQSQTLGLAQFLPLFSCSAWDPSPYTFRSAANPGAIMQYNFLDDDYDETLAKASVAEAKTYRKFWYGDFYPLSETRPGKRDVAAWQLHRPDLNAGLVYVFRQAESPYPGVEFGLRGLDPNATYRVAVKLGYEAAETFELSGAELANYLLLIPEKGAAYVVEYEAIR